jgi:plastocyanin
MLLRAGITAAIVAVSFTVAGVSGAANQSVMALSSNAFSPADVTVNVGEKVTWSNSGGNHNVVLDEGNTRLNAPSTAAWTVEHTFTTVGTFGYYCEVHRTLGMTGIVRVVAPPGGSPPPGSPPPGSPPGGSPPGGGPPAPDEPVPGGPGLPLLSVTLNASDSTPLAGKKVRLFGVVRPARDGRKVQIQKRGRNGKYQTIATTFLRDDGTAKSRFSLRLKVSSDAVLRARVAGDGQRATGVSKTRKLDVHRP